MALREVHSDLAQRGQTHLSIHGLADCFLAHDVSHVMGKKTIGEAVDGEMGLAALREIGVDFAQGHWLSPPGPFLAQVSAGMARTGKDSASHWAVPATILNSTT